jgi:iron complex transport system permease protein
MRKSEVESTYSKRASRWKLIIFLLIIALIITVILSLNVGYYQISFDDILKILAKQIPFVNGLVDYTPKLPGDPSVLLLVRLPRIIAGVLVGSALAASGVLFQGIFRNPMADPFVIGVSSGASVGAALATLFAAGFVFLGIGAVQIAAFVFALITIFFVYNISRIGSRVPVMTLLLSGLAVTFFSSAVVTLLQFISGKELFSIVAWLAGGFSNVTWLAIWAITPFVLIGIIAAYFYARDLNLLALGEDTAQNLGVDIERVKKVLLFLGSMVTAAAVSISGLIGFVGLIIPHMTRLVIGPDHRILLPTSTIIGAIFLVVCDDAARMMTGTIMGSLQLPVGVITALSGAPFFVYLLRRKKTSYAL